MTQTVMAVRIPTGDAVLEGDLEVPDGASGIVLFAHGSGSSRHSPRNRFVARRIQDAGVGTLLFDLLSLEEEVADALDRHLRFDLPLLARRLAEATAWLRGQEGLGQLRVGYFGSSTGGGAALMAAAAQPEQVDAVVSRGGRPDLAGEALAGVRCPVLLLVGQNDPQVLALNRDAMAQMQCPVELEVIAHATHLFEEPGTLEQVAGKAARFFAEHLAAA